MLALKAHLKDEVLSAFKESDDDLYQAGFAKLLKTKKDDEEKDKEKTNMMTRRRKGRR